MAARRVSPTVPVLVPGAAGYFGDSCISACALDPCEHRGACVRRAGATHGYVCECPQGYFGPYCEHK